MPREVGVFNVFKSSQVRTVLESSVSAIEPVIETDPQTFVLDLFFPYHDMYGVHVDLGLA